MLPGAFEPNVEVAQHFTSKSRLDLCANAGPELRNKAVYGVLGRTLDN